MAKLGSVEVDVIPIMPRCRDCCYWNGATDRPAMCMRIVHSEKAYTIGAHSAGILASGQPYLVTAPDFGCVQFEAKAD